MDNRRELILDIVRREFIGPDPINKPGMKQDNGEEILLSDPPGIRYSSGILYPQGILASEIENSEDVIQQENNIHEEENTLENVSNENVNEVKTGEFELMQDSEEMINLSNSFKQSAISITVSIAREDNIFAQVKCGKYNNVNIKEPGSDKTSTQYHRYSIYWNNSELSLNLPNENDKKLKYDIVMEDGTLTTLEFWITYRYSDEKVDSKIYTFSLVNAKKVNTKNFRDKDCYFQAEFNIVSEKGFVTLPENKKININDEDYESNHLLYREVKNYAVGHGCAADWENTDYNILKISTSNFPSYEMKPIVPSNLNGVSFDMYKLSDVNYVSSTIEELKKMCEMYLDWINDVNEKSNSLRDDYKKTAFRHIENCRNCYKRMISGVELLRNDENVLKAFQFMNRAMLMQQLHYNLPLQEWNIDKNGSMTLIKQYDFLPDINNESTWYDRKNKIYGKWRPFQLAFILMNLKSMTDKNCDERKDVDLIWFPTGGGKTEAYLGLSAYTIFIRKIKKMDDEGVSILMRYTLRLLTAQQYERASSMICACEIIRKNNVSELGNKRITIGLWVGLDSTPNTMVDAIKKYNDLYNGKTDDNPFGILKCPWCGAKMGLVLFNRHIRRLPGYKKVSGRRREIIFQCDNRECDFSDTNNNLPLLVIDEAIYVEPPTLLIGTVDKFAMLPFRPEAQNLFGIINGVRKAAPELIIQDELHLISGPLGSMVGHYETLINELCTDKRNDNIISPKIIASTATISRAKEQCHALYNCGKERVIQFPPSGIDAGNSFFAELDKNAIGRQYVGIYAPASSSTAMTSIRLYATLLYAAKGIDVENESKRDPYWTNLSYFNSLRELGQAATWIHADIDEYLHTIYKRRYEDKEEGYKDNRRYIWRFEELTSRIRSDKVPLSLQNLGIHYIERNSENKPVDICLATNMVSVGVDVPRLGLMTVNGQPKTTSEYIQATSRIGRSSSAPGIVFTIYNPGKPRDKSHYEQFKSYHSKIYSHVEPTSVTPFSVRLRERALHAIIIALVRFFEDASKYNDPTIIPSDNEIEKLFSIIENRVTSIDESELDNTMKHMGEIIREWKKQTPQKYHDFSAGEALPLMFPIGTKRHVSWGNYGMPTPTSLRNVDMSSEVDVLQNIYTKEE